ncbi:MAG: hypothetical protein P8M18_01255 [Woeseiaceae bacterium]|nr:hypothetical protein [Woeseiaceae bacterium]
MGGQLVLWASRHWMQAYRRGRTVPPCVWQGFSVAGLVDVYGELFALLSIVAFREIPPKGFGRPDSLALTNVEVRFMEMLHAAEHIGKGPAADKISSIASPSMTRAIVAKICYLLELLHREGHMIPKDGQRDHAVGSNTCQFNQLAETYH